MNLDPERIRAALHAGAYTSGGPKFSFGERQHTEATRRKLAEFTSGVKTFLAEIPDGTDIADIRDAVQAAWFGEDGGGEL